MECVTFSKWFEYFREVYLRRLRLREEYQQSYKEQLSHEVMHTLVCRYQLQKLDLARRRYVRIATHRRVWYIFRRLCMLRFGKMFEGVHRVRNKLIKLFFPCGSPKVNDKS